MTPLRRTAGRVVLLDAGGDVLLIEEREGATRRWLTPGGGVEPGEQPADAAVRECQEETGLVVETDPQAWRVDRTVWTVDGVTYDQTNHYYLTHTAAHRPAVAPQALTDYEREVVLGLRWWTVDELRETTDQVWPADLARWLQDPR